MSSNKKYKRSKSVGSVIFITVVLFFLFAVLLVYISKHSGNKNSYKKNIVESATKTTDILNDGMERSKKYLENLFQKDIENEKSIKNNDASKSIKSETTINLEDLKSDKKYLIKFGQLKAFVTADNLKARFALSGIATKISKKSKSESHFYELIAGENENCDKKCVLSISKIFKKNGISKFSITEKK